MIDYPNLAALAAVLRRGSFEGAAAELGLTQSAVSQRIRALEDRLGAVLVERSQPARATAAGARAARHFEEVRLLEAGLAAELGLAAPAPPVLRIAVNADSLATWLLPALAGGAGESAGGGADRGAVPDPGDPPLYDLVIDDQDHSADWLRRGEVLAAVTAHARPVQGCDSRRLGALRYVATASPAFCRRWFPEGPTAAALAAAPALVFNEKDRLQADWAAEVAGRRLPLRCHRLGSSEGFVAAALLGLGWGMNPEPLVRDHLAAGRLVALAPERVLEVALHWQWLRRAGAGLAPLTRRIRAAAAAVLLP